MDTYRSAEKLPEAEVDALPTRQTYRTAAPISASETELEKKLRELRSSEAHFLMKTRIGTNAQRISALLALYAVQLQVLGCELGECISRIRSRFDAIEARLDKLESKVP